MALIESTKNGDVVVVVGGLEDIAEEMESVRDPLQGTDIGQAVLRPASVQAELPQRHDIGTLCAVCRNCNARHFRAECLSNQHFSTCCNNSLMALTGDFMLQPAPEFLMALLVDDYPLAKHFQREIRNHNSSLAFASFNTTDANPQHLPGQGPRVFMDRVPSH